MVAVPDKRLDKLAEMYEPDKKTPAVIEFVDIAGLVKGASQGAGLGNKFLENIRRTDAIVHVVRCFDDENVIHVEGSTDPIRDMDTIDLELVMSDMEMVDRRIDKAQKAAKAEKPAAAKAKPEKKAAAAPKAQAKQPAKLEKEEQPMDDTKRTSGGRSNDRRSNNNSRPRREQNAPARGSNAQPKFDPHFVSAPEATPLRSAKKTPAAPAAPAIRSAAQPAKNLSLIHI